MRKKIVGTTLQALLLVMLLVPLASVLSDGQGDILDAEHMVEPMLTLLAQSPQQNALTEVEPIMELEDAWQIEDTRIGGGVR